MTLKAIKKIILDKRAGYCVLMSGCDYPIKTNEYILNFFQNNYGINFINSLPVTEVWGEKNGLSRIKDYHFVLDSNRKFHYIIYNIFHQLFFKKQNFRAIKKLFLSKKWSSLPRAIFIRRKYPSKLKPFGGSQWWALPIETIEYINDFVENNKSYLKYHQFTHCPDEIFFQSIISSNFDKKTINRKLTYVSWVRKSWNKKDCPLPRILSINDFDELKNSNELFSRKFDSDIQILDKIDKELLV